jgi:hypothetical protein
VYIPPTTGTEGRAEATGRSVLQSVLMTGSSSPGGAGSFECLDISDSTLETGRFSMGYWTYGFTGRMAAVLSGT